MYSFMSYYFPFNQIISFNGNIITFMRHCIVEFTMARHHGQKKIGYICIFHKKKFFFENHHNIANISQ